MRQFPVSYDTMTDNKYLNVGHFLGQLILNRSIFPKPLGLERYAEPPLPSGKFQTFSYYFKKNPSLT